mgnify:FL=1
MGAPRLKPGATVWMRYAKSRLLFASFLVEGVIQAVTGFRRIGCRLIGCSRLKSAKTYNLIAY